MSERDGTAAGRQDISDRLVAEELAAWLRVLADPSRLQLLTLLARSDRPLTVAEITSRVGLAQSTVSFHLGRLASAQLVLSERIGRTREYRIHPDSEVACPLLREWA